MSNGERLREFGESQQEESKPGGIWKEPVTGMEFVFVKGGRYEMGDTFGDGYDNEKPVHEICVDDFWMGRYEVTEGQWKKVMGKNPAKCTKGDNYPVESVSWDYVQEFIRELNKKAGKEMFRLPTEAEWEYAARSGGKKERFAGCSDKDLLYKYANYDNDGGDECTAPVGSYLPNGLGLYDMSGNVCEWVHDVYSEKAYSKHSQKNPVYEGSCNARVIRGGCWLLNPFGVRCTHRVLRSPSDGDCLIGFRLHGTP